MKKTVVLVLLVIALAWPAMAEDYGQGRTKIGAVLEFPYLAATAGFPIGDIMELNVLAGYDFFQLPNIDLGSITSPGSFQTISRKIVFGGIYAGANLLFTLVDINIGGYILPLSLGPHLGVSFGFGGNVRIDLLANLRWEYTFSFPLNLFVEASLGMAVNVGDTFIGRTFPVHLMGTGGVGIRYVF